MLGALFKEIGTANVPLFTFSAAKRAYLGRDLERWASYWQVPFQFPTEFPLRTVHALRLALVRPDLTQRLYQWAWQEGKDLGDEAVLRQSLGLEGEDVDTLFDSARTPENKALLRENTALANELGVCGVPTVAVDFEDTTYLIWGQDRLCMLDWMLQGWQPSNEETLRR